MEDRDDPPERHPPFLRAWRDRVPDPSPLVDQAPAGYLEEVMTDRELLELASKAAGVDIKEHPNSNALRHLMFVCDGKNWNPLTDDGDALRLAVKLRMNVYVPPGKEAEASVWLGPDNDFVVYLKGGGSDEASVRRAIVRAAAEIGKAMP
jgi:hypothetical protein